MAEACMISIEGVLSKGGPPNGAPIETGLRLYHSLRTMFNVFLSTVCTEPDWIEHWLAINGITDVNWLMGWDEAEPYEIRIAHFEQAQRDHYTFGVVVDSDPQVCAEILHRSTTAMLFSHPRFARPESRPDWDGGLRPWDAIVEEISSQKTLRTKIPVTGDIATHEEG